MIELNSVQSHFKHSDQRACCYHMVENIVMCVVIESGLPFSFLILPFAFQCLIGNGFSF